MHPSPTRSILISFLKNSCRHLEFDLCRVQGSRGVLPRSHVLQADLPTPRTLSCEEQHVVTTRTHHARVWTLILLAIVCDQLVRHRLGLPRVPCRGVALDPNRKFLSHRHGHVDLLSRCRAFPESENGDVRVSRSIGISRSLCASQLPLLCLHLFPLLLPILIERRELLSSLSLFSSCVCREKGQVIRGAAGDGGENDLGDVVGVHLLDGTHDGGLGGFGALDHKQNLTVLVNNPLPGVHRDHLGNNIHAGSQLGLKKVACNCLCSSDRGSCDLSDHILDLFLLCLLRHNFGCSGRRGREGENAPCHGD
mmetsp:Transcript_20364/g.40782  ORF Transcript_20364/g.40782 Transcript_20364/m.40782 type:complete len:309 (+) Transcript_20364:445-1371(+)